MIKTMVEWTDTWGQMLTLAGCWQCDGVFLLPQVHPLTACPYCGKSSLEKMDTDVDRPVYTQAPELMLPFVVPQTTLHMRLTEFAQKTWFAPADLTPENLEARLQTVYLPLWLVDADVQAQWQAEAGYDYQVVSHKEKFQNGQWQTQEVRETRVRWEPRLGTLNRHYDNKMAPALEEQRQLEKTLGMYQLQGIRPYEAQNLQQAIVHLPNRPPADAWPEAREALKLAAIEECRQAAAADHIREFRWTADFRGQNWTQLLLPLYTTFYRDDENQVRMIYLHGQSGNLRGQRRASMRKARRWSVMIGSLATAIFIVSLVLALVGYFEKAFLPWAGGGLGIALVVGVTAVLPLIGAWYVNTYNHFYDKGQQTLADLTAVAWKASEQTTPVANE